MQDKYPRRWLMAIVSCVINLCLGVNYSWSVVAPHLAQRLNEVNNLSGTACLDTGSLAIVFSLTNAILPIPMIVAGAINDKKGPKIVVLVGGIFFGVGMFLTGMVENVGMLIFVYSILVGIGNSLVYTCTVNNTVKFFPDKKGLIGGLTSASYGLGSIIFSPIAQALIDKVGVTQTLQILGILIFVIVVSGSFFLKKCPESQTTVTVAGSVKKDYKWFEMLGTPIFYCMLFMLACGSLLGMLMISQASSVAQEMVKMTPAAAAVMVSLLSAFNMGGRLVSGYLSDKLGRVNVLRIALLVALGGLVLLYFSSSMGKAFFAIGICFIGLCFGSFLGVYPGLAADRFGLKNNSLNYGLIFLGNSIGSIAGPAIMTNVHSNNGSYTPAFIIASALAVLGIILTFVYKVLEKRQDQKVNG